MTAKDFLVRRSDLRESKFVPAPEAGEIELSDGQVLLRIDKFGFSANNITYAALGDAMHYWDFFPGPEGWGRVPVWGFANVVRSTIDEINEGERIFGYLPMAAHLVVEPDRVTQSGFVDAAEHRASLPSVYQRYIRVAGDPSHDPAREDQQALWQPLFMTSFGAADFLEHNDLFGANSVVFSSASSKTAMGIAFLLSQKSEFEVIGLTSFGNRSFVEGLGYYDKVFTYDDLELLSADQPTVFADLAGDEKLPQRLRDHLGDNLKKNVVIGITHWENRPADGGLGSSDAVFFFLPMWLEKRRKDWEPGEFGKRYGEARAAFLPTADKWMKIVQSRGPEAVQAVYLQMLEGKVDPQVGHMLSLEP